MQYSFLGTAPEPRPGLSSGHIPQSLSLTFKQLLSASSSTDPAYETLLPTDKLRKVFEDTIGAEALTEVLDGKRKVTATCGSGMSAAIIWLAMQELGARNVSVYDEVCLFAKQLLLRLSLAVAVMDGIRSAARV